MCLDSDLNSIFLIRKDYVLRYKTLLISSPAPKKELSRESVRGKFGHLSRVKFGP